MKNNEGLLNIEEQLQLALFVLSKTTQDDEINDLALQAVIMYILINSKNPVGMTEDEINLKISMLVSDYVLTSLVKEGLIEPTFGDAGEISYSLTELGKLAARAKKDGD